MQAGDIMTQRVVSVALTATVRDAAQIMLREGISGLPVLDAEGRMAGIITEGDLLRRGETDTVQQRPEWLEAMLSPARVASDYVMAHSRNVTDVMTRQVITCAADTPLREVVDLMEQNAIRRLPVMRNGRVAGIISRANLLRALTVATPPPVTQADRIIRESVWSELCKQRWNPRGGHISVNAGVVDVWGAVTDERERKAVRVAIENVAGVKGVNDHTVLVSDW